MRRLYVSTVGRTKKLEESSCIYMIDYDTKKVMHSVRLPLAMFDLKNPRGGVRGCRGLCFGMDLLDQPFCLWAAGFDGIFRINLDDLFIEEGIWSRDCQDIHQIYAGYPCMEGLFWGKGPDVELISTRNNTLYGFEASRGEFFPLLDLSDIHEGIPPENDHDSRDTLHWNAMHKGYALVPKIGGIYDMASRQFVVLDPKYRGCHDLQVLKSGELALNHSMTRRVITFDTTTWREKRVLLDLPFQKQEPGTKATMPGWVRGMSYLEKHDILFVGSAPARIYIFQDVCSASPNIEHVDISDDICDSVFAVVPHPGDWRVIGD
jgi:hypothetical protein